MTNFHKLRYFITVADEQNFTKAAKKLYISQPSLSQSIHSIEADLDIKLFDRGKNSVTLTRAGKIYYQWAKITLESVHQLKNDLAEIKAGINRQLDVGASWQRSAFLMPDSVAAFYKICPSCNIKIYENIESVLYDKLKSNQLDLAFAAPSIEAIHFNTVPLIQERLLLAAGEDFQLQHRAGTPFPYVNKNEVRNKPVVILQERQNLGQNFRQLLMEINYSPQKMTECVNLETAHKLVKNNMGLSLLPEIGVVSGRLPGVNYYMLEGGDYSRTISAVYRKNHPMEREILQLIECTKNFIRNYNHPFITKF